MTLHFIPDTLMPYIKTSTSKKSIRVVVQTLYFDSSILLSDGVHYPTTPCVPELIDIVDEALHTNILGHVLDDYTVSCVLLHSNMGGAYSLFNWNDNSDKYTISMEEVHGNMINLEVTGLTYDSIKNKILILMTIIRDDGDKYAYYLRSRYS